MSILATDDFAGTGALSASWTANDNNSTTMSRSSGQAISDDATNDAAYRWSALAWPNDQYSQVILGPATAGLGSGYGACVRMDTAGTLSDATHDTFYRLVGSAGGYERIKLVGAAATSLESSAGTTFTSGDTLYHGMVGTQATFKKNGVAFGSPASDSAIASGASGIGHSSTSNVGDGIASWEGGDFASAAVISPTPRLINTDRVLTGAGGQVQNFSPRKAMAQGQLAPQSFIFPVQNVSPLGQATPDVMRLRPFRAAPFLARVVPAAVATQTVTFDPALMAAMSGLGPQIVISQPQVVASGMTPPDNIPN